jgi:hypothetical protein
MCRQPAVLCADYLATVLNIKQCFMSETDISSAASTIQTATHNHCHVELLHIVYLAVMQKRPVFSNSAVSASLGSQFHNSASMVL